MRSVEEAQRAAARAERSQILEPQTQIETHAAAHSPRILREPLERVIADVVHNPRVVLPILLAEFTPLQLRAFIRDYPLKRFSSVTICRIAELERELAKVRRNGYAVDDQEFEEGLKCIGAPVRDRNGSAVAALSVAGPAVRLRAERMPELVKAVQEAAANFCSMLGYRRPPVDRVVVS